jgi:hypothetical protein
MKPGANSMASELTTPALYQDRGFFKGEENILFSKHTM